MSNATSMSSVRRAMAYMNQNGGDNSMGLVPFTAPDRLTPAQTRRLRHKTNRAMGEAGEGTVKPKQVKNRQRRPAPVAGGLLGLLSPKQIRKTVAMRSALRGIKFKIPGSIKGNPTHASVARTMIIDDPVRFPVGKGDR